MKGELYHLTHTTTYDYPSPVTVSYHLLRVSPRRLPRQILLEHSLETEPAAATTSRRKDYFGNDVAFTAIAGPHRRLRVTSHSRVALGPAFIPEQSEVPGQSRLLGADAMHAWVSFFCPGIGSIDLDPTNDCLPSLRHITVAWGRDYSDVSPIRGVLLGSGEHTLSVAVEVVPLGAVPVPVEGE